MPTKDGPPANRTGEHQVLVLELLRRHGPLSRSGLQELTGLARTTLYDTVARLIADGAVIVGRFDFAHRGRGRPVEKLVLGPGTGRAMAAARRSVDRTPAAGAPTAVGAARERRKAATATGRLPTQGTDIRTVKET